jgi:hypothetical protein
MWGHSTDFGADILRHYDPRRLWTSTEAELCFWEDLPYDFTALIEGAKNGWGTQEFFFQYLAELVIRTLMPNLRDSEQGFAFRAVLEILANARLERYHDAPSKEVLEFRFYEAVATKSPPRLAAFFSENWACAMIAEESIA